MKKTPAAAVLISTAIILSGCASKPRKSDIKRTSIYASLASTHARIDAPAARDMISIYRRNHGLPPLALDPGLQKAAEAQARTMAKNAGINASARKGLPLVLKRQRIAYRTAVQNLSAGYHTLPEAFSGWRQSKPHNANMLHRKVRRMGIATAYLPGSKYRVYWALILSD